MNVSLVRAVTLVATAASGLLVGAALWLAVLNRGLEVYVTGIHSASWFAVAQVLSAAVWAAAALVLLQRPAIGWAPLAAVAALSHAVVAAAWGWAVHGVVGGHNLPAINLAVWLSIWMLAVEVPVGVWMGVTIPDGHLAPGRWGKIGATTVALAATGVVLGTLMPLDADVAGPAFGGVRNPIGGGVGFAGSVIPTLLVAQSAPLVTLVLLVRWRRSSGQDRLAMRRVVVIAAASFVTVALVLAGPPGLDVWLPQAIGALQILALLAVVLRHQILGIETVLDRALRYVLLSGLLLVVYATLVVAGDALIGDAAGPVAAVAVALLALPARDRVDRAVSRFVYGERDEPGRLVVAVAERTKATGSPEEMLTGVLDEIASGLRLPWASVTVTGSGTGTASGTGTVAEVGTPPGPTWAIETVDLAHRGASRGVLAVSARSGEDALSPADRRVLSQVAGHVAVVLEATLSQHSSCAGAGTAGPGPRGGTAPAPPRPPRRPRARAHRCRADHGRRPQQHRHQPVSGQGTTRARPRRPQRRHRRDPPHRREPPTARARRARTRGRPAPAAGPVPAPRRHPRHPQRPVRAPRRGRGRRLPHRRRSAHEHGPPRTRHVGHHHRAGQRASSSRDHRQRVRLQPVAAGRRPGLHAPTRRRVGRHRHRRTRPGRRAGTGATAPGDAMTPTLRVLIADDHAVVRAGLRALLATVDGFEVVGEAATGNDAVRLADELLPDVAIIDLQMPDGDGVDATRSITATHPSVAVLVLTM